MTTGKIGPGTLLAGRYRLDDLLAESGGARFWRATDTVLARDVAVHAIPSDDPRAQRLLDAARASATFSDPHLLRVLDCDDVEQVTWVVNEWGDGISLDLMLEKGTLPPDRAAWLAREVAEAIAAGHAQGIAHGRLNPEAVLITHAGAVKLIGYVVDAALSPPRDRGRFGELDDLRADVLDLAGILYAALTGRWPGVSRSTVPAAPVEGRRVLRPRQVRAGVPRALDTICDRALNGDLAGGGFGISTAHEIAAALNDYIGDPTRAASFDPSALAYQGGDEESTQLLSVDTAPETETAAAAAATTAAWSPSPPPEEVPTPEPFEDSPERPLFAGSERRAPAPEATQVVPVPPADPSAGQPQGAHDTGAPAAEFWPFQEEPGEIHTGKEGRGWLRVALAVALLIVLVIAVVVAFNLGSRGPRPAADPGDATTSAPTKSAEPITIASVQDFDPESDTGEENPEDVAKATDGDPATGWPTLTYRGNPELGGLKSGVGLLLDLGQDQDPRSVQLQFASSPVSVEVYAAAQGVTAAPTSIDQLDKVGAKSDAGKDTTIQLENEPTTRFLVVWLTKLPPYPGGFRAQINEVSVQP